MESSTREKIIPLMDSYKQYLDGQKGRSSTRPFSNVKEDFKREIPTKAAEVLEVDAWSSSDIGSGKIGERAIKAVLKHQILIGQFQVSSFKSIVKDKPAAAEKILFDLYHERREEESFEELCRLFGKKYDLISYLYYILDSDRFLPLRPTFFDEVFKEVGINLKTANNCSWSNYQQFLTVIAEVRDLMAEHFHTEEIDLLDAHSFLWTLHQDVLDPGSQEDIPHDPDYEMSIEQGSIVIHKEHGEGAIIDLTDDRVYVGFDERVLIFPYPKAFEEHYLMLK